jgi:molybdopterin/thiamine biosynthesis adenylyltransferase
MENIKTHTTFVTNPYRYWEEAFSRNIGFISAGEQERLHRATVALPGMGGVGGAHLMTLARAGIGRFHLADFDCFEPANINRQHGARFDTFGRRKLDIMAAELLAVNPFAQMRTFSEGVTSSNIDDFLEGVDVLVDSIDFFNIDMRRALFSRARQKGIFAVTAGPIGFGSALIVFAPDRGMTFDRYFDLKDEMPVEEKLIAFFAGLAPKAAQKRYTLPGSISMSGRKGPSLGAGCQICAGAAAAEVLRIILKKPGLRPNSPSTILSLAGFIKGACCSAIAGRCSASNGTCSNPGSAPRELICARTSPNLRRSLFRPVEKFLTRFLIICLRRPFARLRVTTANPGGSQLAAIVSAY